MANSRRVASARMHVSKRFVCCSAARKQLVITLERSVGVLHGKDEALWNTGCFQYAVFPHLPIATTWQGLVKAFAKGREAHVKPNEDAPEWDCRGGAARVTTVAANVESRAMLRQRMIDSCSSVHGGSAALFCVSGSHPVRLLPGVRSFLTDSFGLLRLAHELRAQGLIPAEVEVWAAENPVAESSAARLQAKVAAGAERVLTQPPLAWGRFEGWMADACARGVPVAADVVVGVPMLTSPGNLRFWIQLCGVPVAAEQGQLLRDWEAAAASLPRAEFQAFALNWNRQLVEKLKATKGVAGLHVMPFGEQGRRLTMSLIDEGVL